MQRNSLQLQEQNFLTSGVKAHLGGLGGSEQSHLTTILPLYSLYYILPFSCQVGTGGERIVNTCLGSAHV